MTIFPTKSLSRMYAKARDASSKPNTRLISGLIPCLLMNAFMASKSFREPIQTPLIVALIHISESVGRSLP
jgi:hypothetical protein